MRHFKFLVMVVEIALRMDSEARSDSDKFFAPWAEEIVGKAPHPTMNEVVI